MVALRSARFLNEHATLEVRECANRREIQIIVEAGPATATSSQVLTLRAGEWAQVTQLRYVDLAEREPRDAPPDNVLETFLLIDEHTSLEIRERADRQSVLLVVNGVDSADEDAAHITLTADQWRYLCSLDYVTENPPATTIGPPAIDSARHTIH